MATSNVPSCVLNQVQQFQQDFQQFGRDLQSGRISAAKSDVVTLQKEVPQFSCPQTVECDGQLSQASNQLALGANQGSETTGQNEDSTSPQGYSDQGSAGLGIGRASGAGQATPVSLWPAEAAPLLPAGIISHAQQAYAPLQQISKEAGGMTSGAASPSPRFSVLA
jgi:hypothetical protein